MENTVIELSYALDTLYFLVMGAFVMWMAAGFTMLESGLVRAKNTTEILTKNIALYSISCLCYMIIGYNIMYSGGWSLFLGADNTTEAVLASGGDVYYSYMADHFFSSCICSNGMFDNIRCSCRKNETMAVFIILCNNDKFHLSNSR